MRIQLFIFCLSLLIGACRNNDHAHWDYEGEADPAHWAALSPEFIKCAEGHAQSPINLESLDVTVRTDSFLRFNYHPSPVDFSNNGHTLQANLKEKNELMVEGRTFTLKQIHFHAPSEHHFDGIIYPMETHLVHTDAAGKIAVVGIFIKEGASDPALSPLWRHLPEHVGDTEKEEFKCDLLLHKNPKIFHYTGSLTTPPCTEGVEWFVFEEPITMTKEEIAAFKKLYPHNNRPIQEKEHRKIDILK